MRRVIETAVLVSTLLVLSSSESIFCTDKCKASGIRCVDAYTYQLCMNFTDYAVGLVDAKQCPDGTICDGSGSFACKVGTITTTTPTPTTTVPACYGNERYPTSSCDTYFQCIQFLWWWQPEVQTCATGENFDPSSLECVPADQYPCGTTTTTAATTTIPACYADDRYPTSSCNTYFQCVQFLWWWQPEVQTCPDGQNFDPSSLACVSSSQYPCGSSSSSSTTTTTQAATTVPACSGDAKYPTESCNTYFHCVQFLFWWQPQVETCPDGQNFDPSSLACVSADEYPCGSTTAQ